MSVLEGLIAAFALLIYLSTQSLLMKTLCDVTKSASNPGETFASQLQKKRTVYRLQTRATINIVVNTEKLQYSRPRPPHSPPLPPVTARSHNENHFWIEFDLNRISQFAFTPDNLSDIFASEPNFNAIASIGSVVAEN